MTTTKTTFKKSFFFPQKNVYVIFYFSCSLYFFLGQVWIQQPFNIKVYSTTFFFCFLGDVEKNAPGYLQIILLVYAAKMAEERAWKNGSTTQLFILFQKKEGKKGIRKYKVEKLYGKK